MIIIAGPRNITSSDIQLVVVVVGSTMQPQPSSCGACLPHNVMNSERRMVASQNVSSIIGILFDILLLPGIVTVISRRYINERSPACLLLFRNARRGSQESIYYVLLRLLALSITN